MRERQQSWQAKGELFAWLILEFHPYDADGHLDEAEAMRILHQLEELTDAQLHALTKHILLGRSPLRNMIGRPALDTFPVRQTRMEVVA